MNKERLMQIILSPVVSEKSNNLSDNKGKIVLKVLVNSTKKEIKQAVKLLFNVDAEKVNTLIIQGKRKKIGKYSGKRSDIKKAYVTLSAGQGLDLEAEAAKSTEYKD